FARRVPRNAGELFTLPSTLMTFYEIIIFNLFPVPTPFYREPIPVSRLKMRRSGDKEMSGKRCWIGKEEKNFSVYPPQSFWSKIDNKKTVRCRQKRIQRNFDPAPSLITQ
ncbi:MAG: hypothetical protein NTY64_11190, partial [Deltaproteobacteria bacterium]|nr:hypothetical protein [Deltaproteobacteria bacterium]